VTGTSDILEVPVFIFAILTGRVIAGYASAQAPP